MNIYLLSVRRQFEDHSEDLLSVTVYGTMTFDSIMEIVAGIKGKALSAEIIKVTRGRAS